MCVVGKDVTIKVMKKKPKKGEKPGAGGKPQMKTEKVDSFFNFFNPPEVGRGWGGKGCTLQSVQPSRGEAGGGGGGYTLQLI